MRSIYTLSSRVVVWIGCGREDINVALSTLDELGSQVELCMEDYIMSSPGCREPMWYNYDVHLPNDAAIWDSIYALMDLSWFERL